MKDLCYLSATEALAGFKDKSLSPVDLMQAVIERAEAVEPTINATTTPPTAHRNAEPPSKK